MSAGEKRKRDAAPVVTVKRRGKACSSRFLGVYWFDQDGKWRAYYRDEKGISIHIALFDDEEAAARAYNAKIAELGLNRKTNLELLGVLVEKPGTSSEFYGVTWDARHEKWYVQVNRSKKCGLDGRQQKLGYYDDERSAALAADEYALFESLTTDGVYVLKHPRSGRLQLPRHDGPRHATDGEAHETAGRSHVTARADLVKGAN